MNVLLTDYLACPACQAPGGLILLADKVEARRVITGRLGCAHCRTTFDVVDGVAEFSRAGDARVYPPVNDVTRLAALLGVTEGPAIVLLVGPYEDVAGELAELLSDVEVIVATDTPQRAGERDHVSVMQTGARLPLRDGGMRAVMITGANPGMIAEAVRVAGLAARVVLLGATPETAEALRAHGVHVVAEQDDTLVSVRHF